MSKRKTASKGVEVTAEEADELSRQLQAAEPLATGDDQAMELEAAFQSEGFFRQMVIATMKLGGADLVRMTRDDDTALALAMAEAAGNFWLERSHELNKLIETQVIRLSVSLCHREDMKALQAKARRMLFKRAARTTRVEVDHAR
jgi:hypothetical protein